jgi:antitoxin (DNA-binding transcriptional repressor) of toxin-antitoxin stability system
MIQYGIRQAKSHLSEIVRSAAAGVCTIVTDNRKPVAMIGPLPAPEAKARSKVAEGPRALSDAAFRDALLSAPFSFELDF